MSCIMTASTASIPPVGDGKASDTEKTRSPLGGGDESKDNNVNEQKTKKSKRVARACDQCNQRRTKCDGAFPCHHCVRVKIKCEYSREPRKRGRASESYTNKRQALLLQQQKEKELKGSDDTISRESQMSILPNTGNRQPNTLPPISTGKEVIVSRTGPTVSTELNSGPVLPGPSTATGVVPATSPMALTAHHLGLNGGNSMKTPRLNEATRMGIDANSTLQNTILMEMISGSDAKDSPNSQSSYISQGSSSSSRIAAQQPQPQNSAQGAHQNSSQPHIHHPPAVSAHNDEMDSFLFNVDRSGRTPHEASDMLPDPSLPSPFYGITGRTPNPTEMQNSETFGSSMMDLVNDSGLRYALPVDQYSSLSGTAPQANSMRFRSRDGSSFGLTGRSPDNVVNAPSAAIGASAPVSSGVSTTNPNPPGGSNNNVQTVLSGTDGSPSGVSSHAELRYPVFEPLLPYLEKLSLPLDVACDLLESYFDHSPYVLAYVVRKSSILARENPRPTSAALLCALLLVAAHGSHHPYLTCVPSNHYSITTKLFELAVELSVPLQQAGFPRAASLGREFKHGREREQSLKEVEPGLDDVLTCIQLGTVASASEFKGASMKWWKTAQGLARESKLNMEVTTLPEETREERRRAWWIIYMIDRHLGFCFNQPLALLDAECKDLYHPMDDAIWMHSTRFPLRPAEDDSSRACGISFGISSQGIFGFFLPLMMILGGMVTTHLLYEQPVQLLPRHYRDYVKTQMETQLAAYTRSLKGFARTNQLQEHSRSSMNGEMVFSEYSEAWKDYALYLVHVFHILLNITWDPIELLNSPPELLNSAEVRIASSHAVQASECLDSVLATDPDLRFMPFFIGIYLFSPASTILLYMVDRLGSGLNNDIRRACEIIVRAHEVCIVTLTAEYMRTSRNIMRAALRYSQSGSDVESQEELSRKRKETLAVYRWTGGGYGIAP